MHDIGELHNDFALNIRFLALICLMSVVKTEHEEEFVINLANAVRKQLDLPKEVKALLKPVVSRVPMKSQSQAHVFPLFNVYLHHERRQAKSWSQLTTLG